MQIVDKGGDRNLIGAPLEFPEFFVNKYRRRLHHRRYSASQPYFVKNKKRGGPCSSVSICSGPAGTPLTRSPTGGGPCSDIDVSICSGHAVPAGTLAFHQTFRTASSYQSFWSGCWLSTRPSGKQAATSLSGQAVGFPPSPQGSKQPPVFLARLWLSTIPSGQQAATSLQSGQAVGFPPAPQGSKQLPVFLARLLAFHQPLRLRDTSQCSGSLGNSQ